jgi:hypothetical protein
VDFRVVCLRVAFLVLAVGASYFGTYFLVENVQAQGVLCGTTYNGSYYPCGYYYAGQLGNTGGGAGGYAYGITGRVVSQPVNMYYPQIDHINDYVNITFLPNAEAYQAQMGIWQGQWPNAGGGGYKLVPTGYYEYNDFCDGYHIQQVPLYGPWYMFPTISNLGVQIYCNGQYNWEYQASYELGPVGGIRRMPANLGRPVAVSEHWNSGFGGYMEPNGWKCFGTDTSCFATAGYQMRVKQGSVWTDWGSTFPTQICPGATEVNCSPLNYPGGYEYVQYNPYKNFWTLSQW